MPLLEIDNLTVSFATAREPFRAVDGLSLTVDEGEIVGIVGESGSGKSVSMLALMGLVRWPGKVTADSMVFAGNDMLTLSGRRRRALLGKDIAMVFQEPTISLNPCFSIGFQLTETIAAHERGTSRGRRARAVELLGRVGIPAPESRLDSFPHQLSGGMNQRVMIAMAIACRPKLLIADEPTTALDVTIQAQILDLLLDLQREEGMALILITHNMGVVAETAQRVVVMYAGQVMEESPVDRLFEAPRHPYTNALLAALPERALGQRRLPAIPGLVPGALDRPAGCLFNQRCTIAGERCRRDAPALIETAEGGIRCHTPLVWTAA